MTEPRRPAALGPLLLVVAAAAVSVWLVQQKRTPTFEAEPSRFPLVDVEVARVERHRRVLRGRGEVEPVRSLSLSALVAGPVAWVHPALEPGGIVAAGEPVVKLDRRSLDLRVAELRANLVRVQADLRKTEGQHRAASLTYERVRGDAPLVDAELARREPELRAAQAQVEAARAALASAQLDAERAVLRAPFRCLVVERSVEVGQRVSPGQELVRMVAADVFRVRIPMPLRDASAIDAEAARDRPVNLARPLAPSASSPPGRFVRLTGRMEGVGRQADVLVEIPDPLSARPPIQLGEFLEGSFVSDRTVEGVRIPRRALRGGDQVYVVGPDDRLDIRDVVLAWGEEETVVVAQGLSEGDEIVLSRLGVAVAGMRLDVRRPGTTDEVRSDG
jgi:RND family efflux transporter MFP subunit